jgi:hypothetical protein
VAIQVFESAAKTGMSVSYANIAVQGTKRPALYIIPPPKITRMMIIITMIHKKPPPKKPPNSPTAMIIHLPAR